MFVKNGLEKRKLLATLMKLFDLGTLTVDFQAIVISSANDLYNVEKITGHVILQNDHD